MIFLLFFAQKKYFSQIFSLFNGDDKKSSLSCHSGKSPHSSFKMQNIKKKSLLRTEILDQRRLRLRLRLRVRRDPRLYPRFLISGPKKKFSVLKNSAKHILIRFNITTGLSIPLREVLLIQFALLRKEILWFGKFGAKI